MGLYRMSFLAGLATGYVLGTRDGRERYEQIARLARQVADHPTVQQAAGTLQAQASRLANTASDTAAQKVRAGTSKLSGSLKPGWRQHDETSTPAPPASTETMGSSPPPPADTPADTTVGSTAFSTQDVS
jgi:hypothetical protein